MLFKEIISVYSEIRKEQVNTIREIKANLQY